MPCRAPITRWPIRVVLDRQLRSNQLFRRLSATTSHQQALETLCDLGEPAAQGFTSNELGLVPRPAR
jgi:hypothetical protein